MCVFPSVNDTAWFLTLILLSKYDTRLINLCLHYTVSIQNIHFQIKNIDFEKKIFTIIYIFFISYFMQIKQNRKINLLVQN